MNIKLAVDVAGVDLDRVEREVQAFGDCRRGEEDHVMDQSYCMARVLLQGLLQGGNRIGMGLFSKDSESVVTNILFFEV